MLQDQLLLAFATSGVLLGQSIRNLKQHDEEKDHRLWNYGGLDLEYFVLSLMPTRFKKSTFPDFQLGITLYHLAYECSYCKAGNLSSLASSTACTIFNTAINAIVQLLYDGFLVLPQSEEQGTKDLTLLIKYWEFPCVGVWDDFHVYINCDLKNFFSFKKNYSMTNMGLIASNKLFLWEGVGALGSIYDSTLLQLVHRYIQRFGTTWLWSNTFYNSRRCFTSITFIAADLRS